MKILKIFNVVWMDVANPSHINFEVWNFLQFFLQIFMHLSSSCDIAIHLVCQFIWHDNWFIHFITLKFDIVKNFGFEINISWKILKTQPYFYIEICEKDESGKQTIYNERRASIDRHLYRKPVTRKTKAQNGKNL